jgi:GntR family transcriptional regulator, carbon starvation induced regulator
MKPQTQSDIAFHGLKKDILECRLLPAAKIKINDVCASYGVSLGAAREALSRLAAEGLVRIETQKGFSVAPASWDEYSDLTDARVEIETYCIEKAIQHGDVEWESRVTAALHRLSRVPERDGESSTYPSAAWLLAHTEFHRALVAACPNRCMLELREMLYLRSERYRHWSVALCLSYGQRNVLQEHKDIARFVLARDIFSACTAIREHFMRTANDLLNAARELEAGGNDIYLNLQKSRA